VFRVSCVPITDPSVVLFAPSTIAIAALMLSFSILQLDCSQFLRCVPNFCLPVKDNPFCNGLASGASTAGASASAGADKALGVGAPRTETGMGMANRSVGQARTAASLMLFDIDHCLRCFERLGALHRSPSRPGISPRSTTADLEAVQAGAPSNPSVNGHGILNARGGISAKEVDKGATGPADAPQGQAGRPAEDLNDIFAGRIADVHPGASRGLKRSLTSSCLVDQAPAAELRSEQNVRTKAQRTLLRPSASLPTFAASDRDKDDDVHVEDLDPITTEDLDIIFADRIDGVRSGFELEEIFG
jgi:hypothetical protein